MNTQKAVSHLTWGVFIVMFSMSMCNTIQGTLLTDIIDYYHLEGAMQGMLSSFQNIGGLTALACTVLIAGRVRKPVIILAIILVTMLSMSGTALQPQFDILIMLYILFGFTKGLMDTTASSMIADLHEGRKKAVNIGLLHAIFGIGGLVAPILIIKLKDAGVLWGRIYGIFAAMAFMSLIVYTWSYLKSRNRIMIDSTMNQKIKLSNLRLFFGNKRNWLLLGATLCYSIYLIGYYLWIDRYVSTYAGSDFMGATALALFWVGIAAARILMPRLKLSVFNIIIWGNIAAVLFALIGIWSMSASVIVVCSFLTGLASGAVIPLLLYIGCSWFQENSFMITMLLFTAFYIGQIGSPLAVGMVNTWIGLPWGISLAVIFALISALLVLPMQKKTRLIFE